MQKFGLLSSMESMTWFPQVHRVAAIAVYERIVAPVQDACRTANACQLEYELDLSKPVESVFLSLPTYSAVAAVLGGRGQKDFHLPDLNHWWWHSVGLVRLAENVTPCRQAGLAVGAVAGVEADRVQH